MPILWFSNVYQYNSSLYFVPIFLLIINKNANKIAAQIEHKLIQ